MKGRKPKPTENCVLDECDRPRYGKKEYCQMHYNRLTRNGNPHIKYRTTEKKCLNCGQTFKAKNKCSNTKYCSKKCWHEAWYSESINLSRTKKCCLYCGSEFSAVTYLYKTSYCSNTCRGKHNAENRVKRVFCRQCGVEFETPNAHFNTCPSCARENMLKKVKRRNRYIRYLARGAAGPYHNNSEWEKLLRRHNGKCAYCGERPAEHKDHIIPISKGGTDAIGNILPACRECNLSKGNKLLAEWKLWKKVKDDASRKKAEA